MISAAHLDCFVFVVVLVGAYTRTVTRKTFDLEKRVLSWLAMLRKHAHTR